MKCSNCNFAILDCFCCSNSLTTEPGSNKQPSVKKRRCFACHFELCRCNTGYSKRIQQLTAAVCVLVVMSTGCAKRVQYLTGAQGGSGATGTSCSVSAVDGGSLIACTDGSSSFVPNGATGSTGDTGATGAAGANGTNGTNGQDATPVTVVQLCPGTPSYPSTFIEVALCINNRLYAVYSSQGGFLTEITPGRYSSNAIGSRCNFTAHGDCKICND